MERRIQRGFYLRPPWIDVNPNYPDINVEADRSSAQSVFRYYQRLIALRHASPVAALGDFELMDPGDPALGSTGPPVVREEQR